LEEKKNPNEGEIATGAVFKRAKEKKPYKYTESQITKKPVPCAKTASLHLRRVKPIGTDLEKRAPVIITQKIVPEHSAPQPISGGKGKPSGKRKKK